MSKLWLLHPAAVAPAAAAALVVTGSLWLLPWHCRCPPCCLRCWTLHWTLTHPLLCRGSGSPSQAALSTLRELIVEQAAKGKRILVRSAFSAEFKALEQLCASAAWHRLWTSTAVPHVTAAPAPPDQRMLPTPCYRLALPAGHLRRYGGNHKSLQRHLSLPDVHVRL